MARVDLLSGVVFDLATYDETGAADPAIYVRGELPGTARGFGVHRVYQGAQGTYEEALLLLDPDDVVIWERPYRYIRLRGEMYEDRFLNRFPGGVKVESVEQHSLVLLVEGQEIGRIPVFIEAPDSAQGAGALDEAVEKGLQKSAVVWITIPQPSGGEVCRPAWFVQDGSSVYVLTGPDEQQLTNIDRADEVTLHVKSKDVYAAIGDVPASVRVVPNDSDEFSRIATEGLGTRLNLPDGSDALERWRRTCALVELTPRV